MHALVIIDEDREPVGVTTAAEVEHAIGFASEEARTRGMLNIIYIEAGNDDVPRRSWVSPMATAMLQNYESRGPADDIEPFLSAYGSLRHHTEFPRRCVVPMQMGISAAREFVETGNLPTCVSWAET